MFYRCWKLIDSTLVESGAYNCWRDRWCWCFHVYNHRTCNNNICQTVNVNIKQCFTIIIVLSSFKRKRILLIAFFRRKSLNTKRHTSDLQFCWRSTSAAELGVNTEGISSYQELNFTLEENPYQNISR